MNNARRRAQRLVLGAPRKIVVAIVILSAGVAIALAPLRIGILIMFTVLAAGLAMQGWLIAGLARRIRRRSTVKSKGPKIVRWLEERLWNGFSITALDELRQVSMDSSLSPYVRAQALMAIAKWHSANGDPAVAYDHAYTARTIMPSLSSDQVIVRPPGSATTHFDVIILSNFNLPGGTTSSNAQEIEAQTAAGLRTGLIHHPIYEWNVSRGINPKILQYVDGDQVRLVTPRQRVTCDLLVIRAPKIGERLMDDMPRIDAGQTIFVINQTPLRSYGLDEGEATWDIRLVHDNLRRRFGEHLWYPIGPGTRRALVDSHAAELDGIQLAADDWLNIIDVAAWQRDSRRDEDGRIRVGRHSRDHVGKWPETSTMLTAAYPDMAPYEIHVLGGADTAAQTLGGNLPRNWIVHGFDGLPVRDFLHGLDIYVYFTASRWTEAFGRAPLEALAVGLPAILPVQFRDLFGPAAIYTEPHGVKSYVEQLMTDSALYEQHVTRGLDVIKGRFDYDAHLKRLAQFGVTAAS